MIRLFKHYISYNVVLLSVIDLVLLFIAGEGAWRLRVTQISVDAGALAERIPELVGFAGVVWLAMIAVGT
ncbi:MAG TPA: sugar transferase, partial [Erythrobacter sp.]|nr:sugar transferase [Erythrobacter sp.]